MRLDLIGARAWRGVWLVASVVLGIVCIVGSGGGAGVSVSGCLLGPCPGDFPDQPNQPVIVPATTVVQVGGTAVFTVSTTGIDNAVVQWSRAARGGLPVVVVGTSAAVYSIAGVQLTDDGETVVATVQGTFNGRQVSVASDPARLLVSSMPPVVFQDTEFAAADWRETALLLPATSGAVHSADQAETGGDPGPYRRVSISMPDGVNTLWVFNVFQAASFDPATQGAVYVVDATFECIALAGTLGSVPVVLIEQSSRRYFAGGSARCGAAWGVRFFQTNFAASDFVQVDGPACTAGEQCPDFSASGQPIRFGVTSENSGGTGSTGASGGYGVDNWRVTVWRR